MLGLALVRAPRASKGPARKAIPVDRFARPAVIVRRSLRAVARSNSSQVKSSQVKFSARQQGRLARRRQEWSMSFLRCAPHTPPSISHACARARDTLRCGVDCGAEAAERGGGSSREVSIGCDRQDGNGAGGGSSKARRMIEGDGGGVMGSTTGGGRRERELRRAAWVRGSSDCAFIALRDGPSRSRW